MHNRLLLTFSSIWYCDSYCIGYKGRLRPDPRVIKLVFADLFDGHFVRFGAGLCGQVVGIPVGTSCAPLVADLFLFCYERDFMMSLSDDMLADIIDAFNTASGCLDGVNNVCLGTVVGQVCPSGLRFDKAYTSDTEAAFLDLHLSISNDIVSANIFDKRDDFEFETVNFPFLDGDVPRYASCGVCVSRLVRFAGASGCIADFGARGGLLTRKLLEQGCRCHGLRGAFSEFCRRCCGLISGFRVGLGSLLRQGLSGPGFCGGLVCRLKRIVGSGSFSAQFVRMVSHYGRLAMRWWGAGALVICRARRGLPVGFLLLRCSLLFAVESLPCYILICMF